jgi:glycosyltransferase involved in cell wall biosynthesis
LIVQIAALLPHKDQLGVVEALGRVAELDWQARLVGALDRDPGYATAVESAVRDAGLADRVSLPGELARPDAWSGADLSLLPSTVESYGMVVTEALARGVPAIVSEGGPAEALGRTAAGETPGAVVAAGDPDALAHPLRVWLTCPKVRVRWRTAALERRSTLDGWQTTARLLRAALV